MAEEGRELGNEGSAATGAAAAEEEEGLMEGRRKRGSGKPLSVYFKEESNVVTDLDDSQKKALDELKQLLRAAIAGSEFSKPEKKVAEKVIEEKAEPHLVDFAEVDKPAEEEMPREPLELAATEKPGKEVEEAMVPVARKEEVFLWGVPLLSDEKSDTVLLKFLRARDFKVEEALEMVKNTVIWTKEFGIEGLLEEDLGMKELEKVVFMHGKDKEGHPVCYNVYGEFQDRDMYQKVFTDEDKRKRFLRWRIQFLERGIRQLLDFSPRGICSMVQVTDLKNSPVLGRRELRQATKQALAVFQDNYPEFVAKKVFINVPWWYLAFNRMISPFLTQRTKSKFVFSGASKSSEALFEFIAPEQVPVQYGGLSKDNDMDFCTSDAAAEVSIKPSATHIIEISVSEPVVLVWELRVLGWDVSYGAEFVPCANNGYTIILQKTRKFTSADESLLKNSYRVEEPGKIILTIDNSTSKKKKLLYRSKANGIANSAFLPKKSP